MTNEEAKEILKYIGNNINTINTYDGKIWHKEDIAEAKELAIKALDCCEVWEGIHGQVVAPKGTFNKIWEDAEKEEQEQKTGHWIKQTLSVKPFGEDTVLCDHCAFMTDKDNTYNYCPNCGAKMEG